MGIYKVSKYIFVDDRKDIVFLYNTYKLDMLKMKKNTYQKVIEDLNKDSLDVKSTMIRYLIDNKYLIRDEVDENRLGDLLYMKTCHSNHSVLCCPRK